MSNHTARRSFLTRLGVAAAALGFGGSAARAQTPSETAPKPARHAQDDWFDQLPARHRIFFDCLQAPGTGEAIAFANNFFDGHKSGYGLEASDLGVILCLRHSATVLGYNDVVWAKYGAIFAEQLKLASASSGQPPTANPRTAAFAALIKKGAHFAVCDMASHRYAGAVARRTDGNAEDVYKEFAANLIGNAHLVTAGIIAVNHAQERGYTIAYAG